MGRDPRNCSKAGMESQGGETPRQTDLLLSLPLQVWEAGGGVSEHCWQELPFPCRSYSLTDTSQWARQDRSHKCCCVQQSAARGHCLLCLCLRGSSTWRVKLQWKLPSAVHTEVIRLQNNQCWYKVQAADLQLWTSSKTRWYYCPHRAKQCWRKQKRQFIV